MTYPNNVRVFWMEPTKDERLWLRRYVSGHYDQAAQKYVHGEPCPHPDNKGGSHDAMVLIGERERTNNTLGDNHPHDDPRWPATCACGYVFKDSDTWQLFTGLLYIRVDTGEHLTIREAPPGAMWDAHWLPPTWPRGADGIALNVVTPDGHHWKVDDRASNCTKPDDNAHRCWVRHGDPRKGEVHVDKNGNTCAAGAGSINTGRWHGFLHNNVLKDC